MGKGHQSPDTLGQYYSLEAGLRILAGYIAKYPNSCTDIKEKYERGKVQLDKIRAELVDQGHSIGYDDPILEKLIEEFNAKTFEANRLYEIIGRDFNKRIPEWDKYFDLAEDLDSLYRQIRAKGYDPTKQEIRHGIKRHE